MQTPQKLLFLLQALVICISCTIHLQATGTRKNQDNLPTRSRFEEVTHKIRCAAIPVELDKNQTHINSFYNDDTDYLEKMRQALNNLEIETISREEFSRGEHDHQNLPPKYYISIKNIENVLQKKQDPTSPQKQSFLSSAIPYGLGALATQLFGCFIAYYYAASNAQDNKNNIVPTIMGLTGLCTALTGAAIYYGPEISNYGKKVFLSSNTKAVAQEEL